MLTGFGAVAGNFFGGMLIDAFDARVMYFVFGMIVIVSLVIFTFIERRLPAEIPEDCHLKPVTKEQSSPLNKSMAACSR